MAKDWIGNEESVFKTLGASNHTKEVRQKDDFYATDPRAIDALLKAYDLQDNVWECACGSGNLSKRLEDFGYNVVSTDLVDRGYGEGDVDFLVQTKLPKEDVNVILTNPPYKYASEFVIHSLTLLPEGGVVAMFLKTTFLEGQNRRKLIFEKNPPRYVLQFSKRVPCAKNGDFERMKDGTAMSFCWMIWEKGYQGKPEIMWI